jgi:hypothetical protein
MTEPFDLEKHRAEQERARALGLGYAVLRHIILQAHQDADDGISMGRAVELVREMALRAVDKAVAEERAAVVAWLRNEWEQGSGMFVEAARRSIDCIEHGEHRREEKP